MGLLDWLLGGGSGKLQAFKEQGAVVVDVRTPGEFKSGHVKGAKNIPLQEFQKRMPELVKAGKPVVLCCASGMRSGQAYSMLKNTQVACMNGGSWTKVNGVFG